MTLIGIGIRLVFMATIQQRRERMNRQINERLRTLIAAYKVLGGSFTGDLAVDPRHLRDLRPVRSAPTAGETGQGTISEGKISGGQIGESEAVAILDLAPEGGPEAGGSDRRRRIRDAVEAALSDIILLGTEEHVRLAERAARELVAGKPVHTHDLVVSLRDFIRKALDLDPIPTDLAIPMQGPTRPSAAGGRGRGEREGSRQGGGGRNGGSMGGRGMGGGSMGGEGRDF